MSATAEPNEQNLAATRILDYGDAGVQQLAQKLRREGATPRQLVQGVHTWLMAGLFAVYSIDDGRPVSESVRRRDGSCAQRMACVEALARAYGIPTRVRALWLDHSFWFHRLPLLRFVLPKRTLMPWPQFYLDGAWVDFDEIYGPIAELAQRSVADHVFTNRGQSLFDAVSNTAIDFFGRLRATPFARFDLSNFVVADGGTFDTRDELMARLEPKRSPLGRLIFRVLYGGRAIRRERD
ncbi:MAG: hypothetical protein DMF56_22360 [Acidobacteria bacterium]|nr:MAG: hypothetical protein DMF56_22360 [Acidobacteriota bacterium]